MADGVDRTTSVQVAELVRENRIAVAQEEHHIIGCVHVYPVDADTSAFDMLAAALDQPEHDVERALVQFAEQHIRVTGRTTAQTQILVPRFRPDLIKDRLAAWHVGLGHTESRRDPVEDAYPDLVSLW